MALHHTVVLVFHVFCESICAGLPLLLIILTSGHPPKVIQGCPGQGVVRPIVPAVCFIDLACIKPGFLNPPFGECPEGADAEVVHVCSCKMTHMISQTFWVLHLR